MDFDNNNNEKNENTENNGINVNGDGYSGIPEGSGKRDYVGNGSDSGNNNSSGGYNNNYGNGNNYGSNNYGGGSNYGNGNNYNNGYNNGYYNRNNPDQNYTNYYSSVPNPDNKNNKNNKKKHTGAKAAIIVVVVAALAVAAGFGVKTISDNINESETTQSLESGSTTSGNDNSGSTSETGSGKSNSSSSGAGKTWIETKGGGADLTISEIANKCLPSVVGVSSTFTVTGTSSNNDNMFGYFFGYGQGGGQQQTQQMQATGTGVVMSKNDDGGYYILTNAHVIYDDESDYKAGLAKSVSIVIEPENGDENSKEQTVDAKIVGYDTDTDIAVLSIKKADNIEVAEFGDSSKLSVGDMVVAIGNPLGFELYGTVTSGIVSALDRNVTINEKSMTLIQTDAAINSGNSGGPLINGKGQVIGINSAKMSSSYTSGEASVEGLGFAIPINQASEIADDLINNGYVTGKPQLGIICRDIDESVASAYNLPVGAYVISVSSGGAAEKAGIQQGDVITAIDGTKVSSVEELNVEKNKHKAGDTIKLTVSRQGKKQEISVTLDEKKGEDGTEEQTTEAQTQANQGNIDPFGGMFGY